MLVPSPPAFPSSMDSISEDFTASYPGDPFTRPSQLTPPDGVFITNNFHQTPSVPSDFRMIPIGDIDLLREIRTDATMRNSDGDARSRNCPRFGIPMSSNFLVLPVLPAYMLRSTMMI
ncbi:hypothetical protein MSAN_02479400 [Mycena sanguinolenta]|uniref:Uncharacterized protein n=1 Tax=Mycena sanguinolenta TaxID=230812 RepID=A0A8H6U449_9AGAR|nr:hypothetical protein MSAN_02479400 [Mycena sanguinolenta]